MQKILPIVTLVASLNANAVLGPIPIYLNTEYRTDNPVIGSIASTLSFNADDIKATGANTFLDFLATIPSIGLINPQGNIPAVFIRGGNSEHTLFLVDGVSANDISSPNGAISNGLLSIALNDIEKVEIIKGSGSVLYGSSAIVGIISITTKKGADGKSATVSTKFGTHNSKTYALSASSGNKNGFVRFTHNKYTTDGINAKTGDTTDEKDSISNQTTQIKAGNEHFDVSYLESRNKTEYDGFGGTDTGELGDRKLNKIAISANKKFNNTWKSKLSFVQIKSKRNSGTNANTIGDKFKSTSIVILNDINLDDSLLNIGVSKKNDENTTDNQKLSNKEIFVHWQKNIGTIDINTGVRHIKHSRFGNKNIYNIGIAKYLENGIKLTSSYGTAFNAPSLERIYSSIGNPDLQPETSKDIELGAKKQHSWGQTSINIYKNKMKNRIAYDGTYNAGIPNYFNSGELNAKGVELFINTNIQGYNISFNHDYNKSETTNNGETAKGQSPRRPKNTSNLTINKEYGKFHFNVQIIKKSSSLDDTTYDGLGDSKLKGYTLVNLSSNYSLNNKVKISLNIKNAFDKNYTTVTDYNQLGRIIELGLDYQF